MLTLGKECNVRSLSLRAQRSNLSFCYERSFAQEGPGSAQSRGLLVQILDYHIIAKSKGKARDQEGLPRCTCNDRLRTSHSSFLIPH